MNKYEYLISSGLDFNHLFVLQNINNLPEINKVLGWYELLKKRDYITEDGILTQKGEFIISLFLKKEENVTKSEIIENKQQTFSQWIVSLHNKLQSKLIELTGTSKINLVFDGKPTKYPYFCSVVDLEEKLKKFISRYKMEDLKRIEHLLLKHCEVRNQKILMYILREGANANSGLATDYENYVEEVIDVKPIKKQDYF